MFDINDSGESSKKIPYSKIANIVDPIKESGLIDLNDISSLELTMEHESVPNKVRNGILRHRSSVGVAQFLEYIDVITDKDAKKNIMKDVRHTLSELKRVYETLEKNKSIFAEHIKKDLRTLDELYVNKPLKEALITDATLFSDISISKIINNPDSEQLQPYRRLEIGALSFILNLIKLPAITLQGIDEMIWLVNTDYCIELKNLRPVNIPNYNHMDVTISEYLTACIAYIENDSHNGLSNYFNACLEVVDYSDSMPEHKELMPALTRIIAAKDNNIDYILQLIRCS